MTATIRTTDNYLKQADRRNGERVMKTSAPLAVLSWREGEGVAGPRRPDTRAIRCQELFARASDLSISAWPPFTSFENSS